MISPRNEPEVLRAKGRRAAAWYNKHARKPYGKSIYIALEIAQQAYEAHSLPYKEGLSSMDEYPPDRFTWICYETGNAKECVKLRDDQTGRVVTSPHGAVRLPYQPRRAIFGAMYRHVARLQLKSSCGGQIQH